METSFDALFATPNLWTLQKEDFQNVSASLPFRWTSNARDSARAAHPGMTLFRLPVVELVVRFDGDKLGGIIANIYALGDAGDLSKEKFDALVKESVEAIGSATKVRPSDSVAKPDRRLG